MNLRSDQAESAVPSTGTPSLQLCSLGAGRGPLAVTLKSTGEEDILTNVLTLVFFFPFVFPMVTGSYLLGRAGSNILNCWRKFSQLIKFFMWFVLIRDSLHVLCIRKHKRENGKKSYSVLVDNEMMIGEIMPWLYCQHNVSEGNGIERVHFAILIPNSDH